MNNFWEDEEPLSQYEMMKDNIDHAEQIAVAYENSPEIVEAPQEVLETIVEESAFELDNQESNVIYNARLRLEQAKLYEMLVNHNLFEGVDADQRAIEIVQNELKHYIVKRLEILMGLRAPEPTRIVSNENSLQNAFNEVEIDFLKQLAYKGTLGRSVNNAPATLNTLASKPSVQQAPKVNTLKSLAAPKVQTKIKPQVRNESLKTNLATNSDSAASLSSGKPRRKPVRGGIPKTKKKLESGLMPRELTPQEAEELAKQDLAEQLQRKPWGKMNAQEKAAELRRVNEKYKKKTKVQGALRMPTPEEKLRYYTATQPNLTRDDVQNSLAKMLIKSAFKKR